MIGDLLTLEQLRGMERPTPVWAEIQNKTVEGWDGYWCLCIRGYILTPGLISMYAEKMEGVKFYTYSPVHIDREAWTSEWVIDEYGHKCSKCGEYLPSGDDDIFPQFCPFCGRPLTDEAVEMVMERLEALKDGSTSD